MMEIAINYKNSNDYCQQFKHEKIEDKIGYEIFKQYINLCENNN